MKKSNNVSEVPFTCVSFLLKNGKEKGVEIYRVIFDEWVEDDSPKRGHTVHKEVGFYFSRESAEKELYLYVTQRIEEIDKNKLKYLISWSSKENPVRVHGNILCWIEPVIVNA